MCGRAVQTQKAINVVASALSSTPSTAENSNTKYVDEMSGQESWTGNLNMSPGLDAIVLQRKEGSNDIECKKKKWGLITKGGTQSHPLPPGPTKHFSNKMFNARSETASEKFSFRPLLTNGKTCIFAIDGFYEWKVADGGGKQPYFVHSSDSKPFLIAGLHSTVQTGDIKSGHPEMLHSFTVLTTDACPELQWLHKRQPLFIWSIELAKQYLLKPSKQLLHQLATKASSSNPNKLMWYPVTKRMSNVQYRGNDCMEAITLKKSPDIKSFFSSDSCNSSSNHQRKRNNLNKYKLNQSSSKKVKSESTVNKGGIHSFFQKKS